MASHSRGGAFLHQVTSPEFSDLVEGGLCVLVPVGSVEPHGPHLGLGTDTEISIAASVLAVEELSRRGVIAKIGPAVPYGVTECAAGFPGAVSVAQQPLMDFLGAVVDSYLEQGIAHLCLVNNHLEPAHDQAVTQVARSRQRVSVACPLRRRWARTLTKEFQRGNCHAGQYETSIVMASDPSLVDDEVRLSLSPVSISLSDQLAAGRDTFGDMGLEQAYSGNPAAATADEGRATLLCLAKMIADEVCDAMAKTVGD